MKKYYNVHGSQTVVQPIEVSKDTVYFRYNIHEITTPEGYKLWEYDEEQLTLNEYFKKVLGDNESSIAELSTIFSLYQQQYDSAIAELNILIGGLVSNV